jgi:uncharacterized protein YacL
LNILRGVLLVLIVAVTSLYVLEFQSFQEQATGRAVPTFEHVLVAMATTLGIGLLVIGLDVIFRRKKIAAFSGVFLGLMAGLLVAYALSFVVDLFGVILGPRIRGPDVPAFNNLLQGIKVFLGLITCYVGVSLVLQTKDDFRFVIPYIEFTKQVRGQRPVLLDTSVVIDGRILDVAQAHFLTSRLIVPRFVLNELQQVADSADRLRRARGRRGLDTLQKLQSEPHIDVNIEDFDVEGSNVDQKLVAAAQELKAHVMTNDYNLAKICALRGVQVMNLNDLARAMRPVVLPGEKMNVKVIRPGESPGQAVGYLEDGTMVVVEKAAGLIGQEIDLIVTSTLQTPAGRMVFGRNADAPEPDARPGDRPARDDAQQPADPAELGDPPQTRGEARRPPQRGRNPRR